MKAISISKSITNRSEINDYLKDVAKIPLLTKEEEIDLATKARNGDKKAKDILLLNMEGLSPVTDYYVICSASNTTLVRTIADNIEDKLGEAGVFPTHKEGYADSRWVLLDYGDVVAHIFLEEERDFYNLEQLWADAPSEAFVESEDAE